MDALRFQCVRSRINLSEVTQVEKGFLRCPGAQDFTGLGRSKLLELAYQGEIPSVKVGRCRLFPVAGLRAWVDRLVTDQTSSFDRREQTCASDVEKEKARE